MATIGLTGDTHTPAKKRVVTVRGVMGPPVPVKPEPHDSHMPPSVQATLHPSTSKAAAVKQVKSEQVTNTQVFTPRTPRIEAAPSRPHVSFGEAKQQREAQVEYAKNELTRRYGEQFTKLPSWAKDQAAHKLLTSPQPDGTFWTPEQQQEATRQRYENQGTAGVVFRDTAESFVPKTLRDYSHGKPVEGNQVVRDIGNVALNFVPAGKAAAIIGVGFKGAKLAKDAEQVTLDARIATLEAKAAQTPRGAAHQAAVGKAQHDLQVVKAIKAEHGDTPESRALADAALATAQEQMRQGLKGARSVRGKQEAGYSTERSARFAKAEAFYRDKSLSPQQRQAAADTALRGELPKIDYGGFKELTPPVVDEMKSHILESDNLLTGQKKRLTDALDAAVKDGTVPTNSELGLFEHIFGKDSGPLFVQAAQTGKWKNVVSNVVNTPRTLKATADMSGFLRQGMVALGRHPIITGRNFGTYVKTFKSESAAQDVAQEIASRDTYPLMHAGKVAFTGAGELSPHEEQFAANMLESLGGTKNPIRWSSRSYSAFLNKTRADVFDHLLKAAKAQGHDIHDERLLHDLGSAVNAFTGRGSLPGSLEGAANLLNGLFFSPRLMASRFQVLLKPLDYRAELHMGEGTHPFVRKQYQRAFVQTFGALATVLALAKVSGVDVGVNPRSSDFGKMKFGNTRLDLGAGFSQFAHLAGELATQQTTSSTTGQTSDLGSGFGQKSMHDVLLAFFENKLSPPVAIVNDALQQQTDFGPFDWKKEAASNVTPLLGQDAWDLAHHNSGGALGVGETVAGTGIGFFGGGLQTYGPKDVAKKPTEQLVQSARDAGVPEPDAAILLGEKHKATLDHLSQMHKGDPQGRLDAYLKYYAEEMDDHQLDSWIGQNLPDDRAQAAAQHLRDVLIGSRLAQYKARIAAIEKAQGK